MCQYPHYLTIFLVIPRVVHITTSLVIQTVKKINLADRPANSPINRADLRFESKHLSWPALPHFLAGLNQAGHKRVGRPTLPPLLKFKSLSLRSIQALQTL
jgi:hypothetical protein